MIDFRCCGYPGYMVRGFSGTTVVAINFCVPYSQGINSNGLHSDLASDCALGRPERQLSQGIQVIEPTPETQEGIDMVGRPIEHRSALQQASGEAVYVDDIPSHQGM